MKHYIIKHATNGFLWKLDAGLLVAVSASEIGIIQKLYDELEKWLVINSENKFDDYGYSRSDFIKYGKSLLAQVQKIIGKDATIEVQPPTLFD